MRRLNRVLFWTAISVSLGMAQSDPPGRVGRISYLSGTVTYRPGGVEDWVPAEMNRPLTTGDQVWIDEGGRAELHIGAAVLRLNSRTAFEFLNLNDASTQIRLTEGSLHVRVRSLGDQDTFEVDTPNLAFSLLRTGDYRIDVNPDNASTTVTVLAGEGEATGGSQAFPVHPGEQTRVSGTDNPVYETRGAPPADEWDGWCSARDRREDQSQSARYVSREMVGYQDLDDHGSWRTVPDYGPVWVPRDVAVGWAPYHYGHWAWVEPWGWTWVDDAPWGFAPFHYGRWAYVGYWAWVPGPVAVRPVYAPALVAWVGGPGFSLSIGVGGGGAGVAWFPLGPREVYVPAYRASPTYINRVNITNTTIVNNINITNINTTNIRYVNREAPGAVTAVPQNAFASARPVQAVAVPVQAAAIRSAAVINTAPVAPSRESVIGRAAPAARVAQPPQAVQQRAVVARATPPPAPVPFVQRQQALAANPGRPLDAGQVQQLRSAQPPQAQARPYVRQAQTAAPPAPAGFNRPTPAGTAPAAQTAPGTQGAPGGAFPQRPGQPAGQTAAPPPYRTNREITPPQPPQQNPPAATQAQPPQYRNNREITPQQPPQQQNRPAPAQPPPPQYRNNREITPQQPPQQQNRPAPAQPPPPQYRNNREVTQPPPQQQNAPAAPPQRETQPRAVQPQNRPPETPNRQGRAPEREQEKRNPKDERERKE